MGFNKGAYYRIVELIRNSGSESAGLENAFADLIGTDPLTGVYNRRAMTERLAGEIQATMRGHPLSVGILDIDFFKKINDQFGHGKGDDVLVDFANFLTGRDHFKDVEDIGFRETDSVGRYGGEEFQIILPDTALMKAYTTMDRVREKTFDHVGVNVSGGVTSDTAAGVPLVLGERGRNVVRSYFEGDQNALKFLEKYLELSKKDPVKVKKILENVNQYLKEFPGDYELLQTEPEIFASRLVTHYADKALYVSKNNGRNMVTGFGNGFFHM